MTTFIVATLIFFDSIVGFVSGFGTSTLLLPVLLWWYPAPTALILTGIVHLLNNLGKIVLFVTRIQWRLFVIFGVPAALCSLLGAHFVFLINREVLLRSIGILLLIYVIAKLAFNHAIVIKKPIYLALGGVSYGLLEGLTGIGGALRAALFSSYNMTPAAFIATNGMVAILVDVVRVATYANNSRNAIFGIYDYALFIAATLAGTLVGRVLVGHLSTKTARHIVLIVIVFASLKLIVAP